MVPRVGIDPCGIRPVGLDGDHREPMLLNEPTSDCSTGTIEFRRAVSGLAQENDLGVTEAIETGAELVGLLGMRQRFEMGPQSLGQAVGIPYLSRLSASCDAHEITREAAGSVE